MQSFVEKYQVSLRNVKFRWEMPSFVGKRQVSSRNAKFRRETPSLVEKRSFSCRCWGASKSVTTLRLLAHTARRALSTKSNARTSKRSAQRAAKKELDVSSHSRVGGAKLFLQVGKARTHGPECARSCIQASSPRTSECF